MDLCAVAVGFRVRVRPGLGDGVGVVCEDVRGGFVEMVMMWKSGRRRGGYWVWRRRAIFVVGVVVDEGVVFDGVGDDDCVDAGVAGCVGKGMWAGKLRMRPGLGGRVSSDGVRSLRSLRGSLVERRPRSANFLGVRSLAGL